MVKKILFILLASTTLLQAQHTLSGSFSPPEKYKWAILYKMSPTRPHYLAQGKIEQGKISFTLDSTQTKGVYKVVYDIPQEEFNFDVLFNGNEDITFSFDSKKGIIIQSEANVMLAEYMNQMSDVGIQIGTFYTSANQDEKILEKLFKKQKEIQSFFEKKSENTLAFEFVKANKPFIPDVYVDAATYITLLQEHYFDPIDYTNPLLQSANFLMERTLGYMFGFVPDGNPTEAYQSNFDVVYTHLSNADENFQKSFMYDLWHKLVNYQLGDTANYMAEKYLIPLATKLGDHELAAMLTQFKNLSIGNPAPDFSWTAQENGKEKSYKLSELDIAQNYILVFWSSTCSHCLKEIPLLQKMVKNLDSTQYKVIAVGLEDEENTNWKSETYYYPEFLHVYAPGKWNNEIGNRYGITGTPTYFVLDKDKRIIAKPQSFEELKAFIMKNISAEK